MSSNEDFIMPLFDSMKLSEIRDALDCYVVDCADRAAYYVKWKGWTDANLVCEKHYKQYYGDKEAP